MVTSKTSAKTTVTKTVSKKVASKKASAKKTPAKKATAKKAKTVLNTGLDQAVKVSKLTSDAMGMAKKATESSTKVLSASKIPEAGKMLLTMRKKDFEALRDANKKSYEELKTVMKRNMDMITETMKEWQQVGSQLDKKDLQQSYKNLDSLSRKTLKNTFVSLREIGEQAASSQVETLSVIRQRIKEDMAMLKDFYKPKK